MLYVMVLVVMMVTVMHRVVLRQSGIRAKQQCADSQSDRHKGLFHDSNSGDGEVSSLVSHCWV
jgi:hypothetical protein